MRRNRFLSGTVAVALAISTFALVGAPSASAAPSIKSPLGPRLEGSTATITMLEQASRAAVVLPAPPDAPILVPGPLVIDREVTLVGLHLIVDGSVIITSKGSLRLYGVTLEIRDTTVRQQIYDGNVQPQLDRVRNADDTVALAWYDAYYTAYTALYPYYPLPSNPPAPPAASGPLAQAGQVIRDNVVAQRIVVNGNLSTFNLADYELPGAQRFDPRRSKILAHKTLVAAAPTRAVRLIAMPEPGSNVTPRINLRDTDIEDVNATLTDTQTTLTSVKMDTIRLATVGLYPLTYSIAVSGGSLTAQDLKLNAGQATSGWGYTGLMARSSSIDIRGSALSGPPGGYNSAAVALQTSTASVRDSEITSWGSGVSVDTPSGSTSLSKNLISTSGYYGNGVSVQPNNSTAPILVSENQIINDGYGSTGVFASVSHYSWMEPTGLLSIERNHISTAPQGQGLSLSVSGYMNSAPVNPVVVDRNLIDGSGYLGIAANSTFYPPAPLLGAVLSDNTVKAMTYLGLQVGGTIKLLRNTLDDNNVGISIPYTAASSIPLMEGNVVNGFNIDGTVRPAERIYYYKQNSTTVSGRTMDAGNRGALTAEGLLTFYDSTGITIHNATLRRNVDAIHLEESSGTVSSSFLTDNRSAGIKSQKSSFTITGNRATNNATGISVSSALATRPIISSNVVWLNQTGIYLESVQPDLVSNEIRENSTGLQLSGASPTIKGSTIVANGVGINASNSSPRLESAPNGDPVSITSSRYLGFAIGGGAPVLLGTRILDSQGVGIEMSNSSPLLTAVEIRGNLSGGIRMSTSSPQISNSTIANNTGTQWVQTFGLWGDYSSSPTVTRTKIVNNGNYGIAFFSAGQSAPRITQSCVSGHTDYGMFNGDARVLIDAQQNWWGAANGPSGAGTGGGDAVSDRVDFANFLSSCTL